MLGGVLVEKLDKEDFSDAIEKFFLAQTGININYAKLLRDDNGKILPISGWHLSVSHSENYLAVAVFYGCEVGIDIEGVDHETKLNDRVLRKVLSPGEEMVDGSFLNNFVIKEAYSKYLGEGLSMGFSKRDANDLLKKENIVWQNYSTSDYCCYVVRDIM